jgi:glycine dehydrogenase subunit 1
MVYSPNSAKDREAMLKTIGFSSVEELFDVIPEEVRFPDLDLPLPLSEMEAAEGLANLAKGNVTNEQMNMFLGAGAYHHYVPAAIPALISRGEFLTAYTPYQPEVSQGTLQSIFEYQTMICALTGMDVSNASHYDGATSVAEAVNMAQTITKKKKQRIILSPGLNPQYVETVFTYAKGSDLEFVGYDLPADYGMDDLIALIDDNTALVMVQYPDFYGRLMDYETLGSAVHAVKGLLGVAVNPLALAIFRPPSEFGADIVCGEGQPLGIPLSYGGPYLGILATKEKHVRSLAGRLVGETVDKNGQRGYVLTLSTREQHIRRERAASNICSNQGIMALSAAIYLSLLGKNGLKHVANLNYQKAHYAQAEIAKINGFKVWGDAPFFNEFVIECPEPASMINEKLLTYGIIGGYDLGRVDEDMSHLMMFAVTEMNSAAQIDDLIAVLKEVAK